VFASVVIKYFLLKKNIKKIFFYFLKIIFHMDILKLLKNINFKFKKLKFLKILLKRKNKNYSDFICKT
jgi:hypothetical protein